MSRSAPHRRTDVAHGTRSRDCQHLIGRPVVIQEQHLPAFTHGEVRGLSGLQREFLQMFVAEGDEDAAPIALFWTRPENSVLYQVGKLLAVEIDSLSVAERLTKNEEFEMDNLTMNGRVMPLQAGFKLSLRTLKLWGCPA